MTQPDDRVAQEPEPLSGDGGQPGGRPDSHPDVSVPAEGGRTGEEQAAINRENDPPA